jgi:hypoxanthine phosphoribosyltransferase
MNSDIKRIIIKPGRIADRVREMADEISEQHRDLTEPLIIITVLTGALVFLADLIRQMPIRMALGVIGVSSYPGATTTSRGARIKIQLEADAEIKGRNVIIVDDILDTGNSLRLVQRTVQEQGPARMETAVLLRKPSRAPQDVTADYIGFDIEDEFVVGYGLDYDGQYRNLPHLAVLKEEKYRDAISNASSTGATS